MSISIYARINKKCIDENKLEKMLVEFFKPVNAVTVYRNEKCTTYEELCKNNDMIVNFVYEKRTPYNVYDSKLCNGEFEYMQLLIFDIKKETVHIDQIKTIFNFCIFLKGNVKEEILVTSDVYEEICLLKENEVIWLNKLW